MVIKQLVKVEKAAVQHGKAICVNQLVQLIIQKNYHLLKELNLNNSTFVSS